VARIIIRSILFALALVVGVSGVLLTARPASADDEETEYARLLVITNFDETEIEINGVSYPYEWIYGDMNGVLLPADRMLDIVVSTSPEQRRTFRLRLDPDEFRVLVVDIANLGAAAPAPVAAPRADEGAAPEAAPGEEEGSTEEIGYLGVSSSPRGIVHVDGASTDQRTPARRIPLEPGRHEVTVFYDEEEVMSEVKYVLIRPGVNTNVFFRLRRDQAE
jgi:hypothetical protein